MLDSIFILIFLVCIAIYFVKFNYSNMWLNFVIGVIFVFLGMSVFATGWQSSNTTLGTFHANDINATATEFSYTPQEYVGNVTQTEEANYEPGVTIIAAVFTFLGLGMIIGRDRGKDDE